MNRFCCCGELHEVVSYVSAYAAVQVDDPKSTASGRMFTRGELVLGILYLLAELAWFFIEKGTTSHWHPTVAQRQKGVSLFGLVKTLLGIGGAQDEEAEEDEQHGEERRQSPDDVEKKAKKTKKKMFKRNSKREKKAGKRKKAKSDSDNPEVAKLEDKVDELEVRLHCNPRHRSTCAFTHPNA